MEDNKAKETSNRWYKKQERKKDQEVQNMLTLKSEEKKSVVQELNGIYS